MSAPMVCAILDGRKTQTRRAVSAKVAEFLELCTGGPEGEPGTSEVLGQQWYTAELGHSGPGLYVWNTEMPEEGSDVVFCPHGMPGDRLWIKETHFYHPHATPNARVRYRANDQIRLESGGFSPAVGDFSYKWRPSIFMPRWANRLSLDLVSVRLEKLHDITPEDAIAEGLAQFSKDGSIFKWGIPDRDGLPGTDDHGWEWKEWERDPRDAYRTLWGKVNKANSWETNPWVWVETFAPIAPEVVG